MKSGGILELYNLTQHFKKSLQFYDILEFYLFFITMLHARTTCSIHFEYKNVSTWPCLCLSNYHTYFNEFETLQKHILFFFFNLSITSHLQGFINVTNMFQGTWILYFKCNMACWVFDKPNHSWKLHKWHNKLIHHCKLLYWIGSMEHEMIRYNISVLIL